MKTRAYVSLRAHKTGELGSNQRQRYIQLGEFIAMHGCNFKIRRNEKRITHCQLRLIGLNGQVGAVAVGVKCVESEGERIEN